MAQQIKMLSTRPDNLSSILGIHIGGREATSAGFPLTFSPMLCTCMPVQTHTHTRRVKGNENFYSSWLLC